MAERIFILLISKNKFLIVNHLPLVYLSTGAILSSCPVSQVCPRISFPQVKGCFEAFAVKKNHHKKTEHTSSYGQNEGAMYSTMPDSSKWI